MIRLRDGRATMLLIGRAAFFRVNAVLEEFIRVNLWERAVELRAHAAGAWPAAAAATKKGPAMPALPVSRISDDQARVLRRPA